jgi:hypothetical protein
MVVSVPLPGPNGTTTSILRNGKSAAHAAAAAMTRDNVDMRSAANAIFFTKIFPPNQTTIMVSFKILGLFRQDHPSCRFEPVFRRSGSQSVNFALPTPNRFVIVWKPMTSSILA